MRHYVRFCLIPAVLLALSPALAAAQPLAFEDVVRNLRNPDPEMRMSAVQLLRDANYPEAMLPMAPLVNDPITEIQLEVLAAQLGFFLVEDIPSKSRIAFILEKRSDARASAAFEMGPLAAWPKKAPAELISALLKAIDDEDERVRLEAIYTVGVIGDGAIGEAEANQLILALDHYDPAIRAAAARVIGRLRVESAGEGLIKAMNDSNAQVRSASMRALGQIGDETAVKALMDQLTYYGKGEAAWSALDALARIAHPSSVQIFKDRLSDGDPWMRRAAAEGLGRVRDQSAIEVLRSEASGDESAMVRAAMSFALIQLGQAQPVRIVDFMESSKLLPQVQEYLLELGPSIAPQLLPRLQEPGDTMRRGVIEVLGELGDDATIAALEPFLQDRNGEIVKAATRALERIKMRTP